MCLTNLQNQKKNAALPPKWYPHCKYPCNILEKTKQKQTEQKKIVYFFYINLFSALEKEHQIRLGELGLPKLSTYLPQVFLNKN